MLTSKNDKYKIKQIIYIFVTKQKKFYLCHPKKFYLFKTLFLLGNLNRNQ